MRKKFGEIVIITLVSFSALFFTTGCSFCYSCGRNTTNGCMHGCANGIEGCLACIKCSGCLDCEAGCEDACSKTSMCSLLE